jgi:hypothetical protein
MPTYSRRQIVIEDQVGVYHCVAVPSACIRLAIASCSGLTTMRLPSPSPFFRPSFTPLALATSSPAKMRSART